ncbi:MAG: 16S rRNA (guanine(966)-N(2))-methyltransferase RsmD [Nitriliruptoraceae bacterium]
MTRIVAGTAKGRRLQVPRGDRVRPTTDRVKEAIFSSLQPRLGGAVVLDLYAGSGGLGLEAASRGAARVVMVERDRRALDALRRNVATVGLSTVVVVDGDVERVLAQAQGEAFDRLFDVVLADPPYDLDADMVAEVLSLTVPLMGPGGIVVVERSTRSGPLKWPDGLVADVSRRYGDTTVHRARRTGCEDADSSR